MREGRIRRGGRYVNSCWLLVPGNAKVTFRPVKLEEYADELVFLLGNGSFTVPLLGRLPKLGIQVDPQEESFGYVAVMEHSERTVVVTNTGDVGVQYTWRLEKPFSVTPLGGHIPQGGAAEFTVRFAPTEASVFSAQVFLPPHLPSL
jgi:hypothetical protein